MCTVRHSAFNFPSFYKFRLLQESGHLDSPKLFSTTYFIRESIFSHTINTTPLKGPYSAQELPSLDINNTTTHTTGGAGTKAVNREAFLHRLGHMSVWVGR